MKGILKSSESHNLLMIALSKEDLTGGNAQSWDTPLVSK